MKPTDVFTLTCQFLLAFLWNYNKINLDSTSLQRECQLKLQHNSKSQIKQPCPSCNFEYGAYKGEPLFAHVCEVTNLNATHNSGIQYIFQWLLIDVVLKSRIKLLKLQI
jgi:hypothetical protein